MKKFFVLASITILLIVGFISKPIFIKADSGFDSSWDSGSDWGSDSSWDSGSSWDYDSGSSYSGGSYSGSSSPEVVIIFAIIIFVVVISLLLSNKTNNNVRHYSFRDIKSVQIKNGLSNDFIKGIDPNLDVELFKQQAFDIYKDLQTAWMNFDYDKIRSLVSDEMYNMYSMQLDTLKVKGQKNIMDTITYLNSYITRIEKVNDIETVKLNMVVECYDYLVDDKNNVIRGNKNVKMHYEYELTFTRNINGVSIDKCPNCGADISINSSGVCEYCNSTIVNKESDWILVKKEMLRQGRK